MPQPQPISQGRPSQGIPVLRTKRMPVRALRSSKGLRPGKRKRRGLRGGSRGSRRAHNSSETRGLAIGVCLLSRILTQDVRVRIPCQQPLFVSASNFSPAEFEAAVRSALEVSDGYVWIYTERP